MKQVFWFLCAIIVSTVASGALVTAEAQVSSPTPDPFIAQLTNIPSIAFRTLDGDMSADGRFVVFVSNGNVATQNRNNADGNFELYLADYAQRRIFQLTNTKNVPNPAPSPSPTPTPSPSPSPTASPSPTPSPLPVPEDLSQVKIHILNKEPMMTLAPQLVGGLRVYTIVFSSNAPNPANFDGTEGNLGQDANTEIWIYRLPAVADVNLTLGTDLPFQDLAAGTFSQITNTPASRLPTAGSVALSPFFADDNREASISEDGRYLAFTSTRNLVTGVGNVDGNPEIFFYDLPNTTFVQGTNTATTNVAFPLFQSNPTLSSDGSVVAFFSNANLVTTNADNNGEVFIASFTGAAMTNIKQVTRTTGEVNLYMPGRRMSRNGAFITFESVATDPKAATTTQGSGLGLFVYTVATDTFVEVGARPTDLLDLARAIPKAPIFSDYQAGTLAPSSLLYFSTLNFRANGTIPPAAQASEGLNPNSTPQVFRTQVPASTSNTFTRLTNTPGVALNFGPRVMSSASSVRTSFVLGGVDIGTGNTDSSNEIYYMLSPIVTAQDAATLTFNSGASNMPIATATPVPSPSPSPTPTPSPSPGVGLGLAPGQLSIARSTVPLAASTSSSTGGSETTRSPAMPIELNGVSLSVNGAAAGLYFVGNAEKQINFVMPITAAPGLGTVAVNVLNAGANTDTALRGFVPIVIAQPDIFSSTGDALGDALAFNVTNPSLRLPPPFTLTSTDASGATVPTVVELQLTGIRLTLKAELTLMVGTTQISGDAIVLKQSNPEMPGFDIINFTLPADLAGVPGDLPVIVTFARVGGITSQSRPADTAPKIRIN